MSGGRTGKGAILNFVASSGGVKENRLWFCRTGFGFENQVRFRETGVVLWNVLWKLRKVQG